MSVARPCVIKVKTGVYVNLSNTMSYAVEEGLSQYIDVLKENGNPKNPEDYEKKLTAADTVSFYYPNNQGLAFRVGHEIKQSDYIRMKRILTNIDFKEQKPNDRKPNTKQIDKSTK